MNIVYRNFEFTDYPAARTLWEATPGVGMGAADAPASIAAFLARNPGGSFVATAGGELVGTILCGHDGRRGLIHHLVTAGSHRRQGIGVALLQRGLAALQAQGIDKCHLLVFRDNADGMAFWRSVGASERTELSLFSMSIDPVGQALP